jgi:predicted HAD superfamily phosphohydrolase YqeG
MQVITNELRVAVDVDNTIIKWVNSPTENSKTVSYYGTSKEVEPNQAVIAFVKSLKQRGYHVTVHSNNGWQWAKNVVEALELESVVDLVCTKSSKCIDDELNVEHIIGTLINPEIL